MSTAELQVLFAWLDALKSCLVRLSSANQTSLLEFMPQSPSKALQHINKRMLAILIPPLYHLYTVNNDFISACYEPK